VKNVESDGMRRWAALAGVILAAQLCFYACIGHINNNNTDNERGQAFVTQASAITSPPTYDTYFGDNWGSVRVFQLMTPCKPLKIFVETNNQLYNQRYSNYIALSLSSWAKALDGRLVYILTTNRQEADITVTWVPRFDDRYIAGLTTFQVGHADIQIKTIGVPEKDIKANIIHEFGHAFGIAGHSENAADIMVGSRRWRHGADAEAYEPKLSRNDVQAIRRLYSTTWQRGEDLYSSSAQRAVLPSVQPGALAANNSGNIVNTAVNNVINLQPLDNQVSYPEQD
jgi:hypothetical protein